MTHRAARRRRLAATGLLAGGLLLLASAPADAHVRVKPDSTEAGSFSALTFRVPNESDSAGTVKLVVTLPQDRPFLYVSVKPVPGWTATLAEAPLPAPIEQEGATITKAVRTVTWTAEQGTQIRPGEFQEFALSAGPLPDPGEVVLPATQTYSDGTVVAWDQVTPASGEEPEHPAPEFTVTAAVAGDHHGGGAAAEGSAATASAAPDLVARGLGTAGLILGAVAAVFAGLAWRRVRATV